MGQAMDKILHRPARDDNPDPASGLTSRDIQLIRQSWYIISHKSAIRQNGVEFFVQLFRKYPDIQDDFKLFMGMTEEQLRASAKVRAHALSVMNMITAYIDNIGDPPTLVALIQKVAIAHYHREIGMYNFEKLAIMFPSFLQSRLGWKYVDQMEVSWTKLFTFHNALVAKFIQEEEENKFNVL